MSLDQAQLDQVDELLEVDWSEFGLKRSRSRFVRHALLFAADETHSRLGGLPEVPLRLPRHTRVY